MEFKAKDIAEALGGVVVGDENCTVSNVSELNAGKPGTLSFYSNPKYESYVYTTEASIVLVDKDFEPQQPVKATLIKVSNAYAAMATLLQMYEESKPKKIGVEQPSFVSEKASVGKNAYIGAFAYIGANAVLGDEVKIYPNTYIGEHVTIGNNVKIYAGVKVYGGAKIGNNCIIHAGTVIGSDGFGFAPQEDGTYQKIPQLGNVVIEDNVEIGANSTIDRAMMGTTFIRKGVKLDNLVQIAHNCEIKENTVIAAQSGIAGSTTVGKNCVLGGQVGVVGHITVADGVQAQAKTGITAGTKPHTNVMGVPAIDLKSYYKSYAVFKQLPDIQKDIKELKRLLSEK